MSDNLSWMESRSLWLIRLLWVMAVLDVIAVASGLAEFSLLRGMQSGDYSGDIDAAAEQNDTRQTIIGICQFALWLVAGIFSLIWIHRANRNARDAGATGMRFTPGWAIGWYFIPIANLWKPYQAMTEIWRASATGSAEQTPPPRLFPWWWALWLVGGFAGNLAFRLSRSADTIDELITLNIVFLVSDVATVALNLVFAAVVKEIRDRQLAFRSIDQIFA